MALGAFGVAFESALKALLASGRTEEQAFARNYLHEAHIGAERVARFQFLTRGAPSLRDAISAYFHRQIRSSSVPDFLDPSNALNVLRTAHHGLEMGQVVDMCGLGGLFSAAHSEPDYARKIHFFSDFFRSPDSCTRAGVRRWLDEKVGYSIDPVDLPSRTVAEPVAHAVIDALELYGQDPPFHPQWCFPWGTSAFDPSRFDPNVWTERLGLPSHEDTWVLVLRFRVEDAPPLCAPTALEAPNAHYFPVPPVPAVRRATGGRPVYEGPSPAPTLFANEFIVPQFLPKRSFWSGLLGRRTRASERLELVRKRHHDHLRRAFGDASVTAWMDGPL